MKLKYRFSHRSDNGRTYYWEGPRIPGDSRSEMVRCNVQWFWSTATKEEPNG